MFRRLACLAGSLLICANSAVADNRLQNLSTRASVQTGDGVLIGGFIIGGDTAKTVYIRTRGPSLAEAGVAGPLLDPVITLNQVTGEFVDANDSWMDHPRVGEIPAGLAPTDPAEAALVATLAPGAYTPIVTGVSGGTGVGIVEVFEVDTVSRLQNISTRGFIGTGDDVMIGGFIIGGDTPKTVIIRGRGPSLTNFGVSGALSDPVLTLTRLTGELLDTNDNFGDHSASANLPTDLVPTNASESAIMITLDPGAYTAILSGVGGATGIGIVEVFEGPEPAATAQSFFADNVASQVILGRCQVCHNPTGIAAATSLLYTTDPGHETANYDTLRDYVAADTSRATTILQKGRGENHGGGAILSTTEQAYLDLSAFLDLLVADLGGGSNEQTAEFWDGVALASPEETLRRAALIVSRRMPTDEEMGLVASGSDADLRSAVRGLMDGEGFHEFLIQGANDRLHTDAFLNGLFLEVGDLNISDILPLGANLYSSYPQNEVGESNRYMWIRGWQYGMARAPAELIAHVVENDHPYTEILTADYTMVNFNAAYVMRSQTDPDPAFSPVFASEGHLEFRPGRHHGQVLNDDSLVAEFTQGVGTVVSAHGDFIAYPHAGVLNTGAFLNRYPTTETNRNRARARWTFMHFLGVDIEASAARTTDPVALADTNNPTMNNPACTVCHAVMDPLAGTFQNYGDEGFYRNSPGGMDALPATYKHPQWFDEDAEPSDYQDGDTWFRDMREPGLGDLVAPDASNSLAWAAQQIVADPRFASAAVKFWWPALMGDSLLDNPQVSTDQDFDARLAAFEEQDAYIGTLAQDFAVGINEGATFNMRDLLTELIMSPWFRGQGAPSANPGPAFDVIGAGGRRLLTPDELDRKTAALIGWRWDESENEYEIDGIWTSLVDRFSAYYGGVDHNGIQTRARALTSLMANVAERHAINMACPAVVIDFERPDSERMLFDGIAASMTPLTEAGATHTITADVFDTAQTFTLSTDMAAGETSLVIYFANDWYDAEADPDDRNVIHDHIVVRRVGGDVVLDLPAADLPDHPGVGIGCGAVQWNPVTGQEDIFNQWSSCDIRIPVTLPADGTYAFEVTSRAEQAGPDHPILEMRIEATDALAGNSQGASAIKAKLVDLHERMLGERLPVTHDEINESYRLLAETWLARRAGEHADQAWYWENELCNIPAAYDDGGANRRWEDPTSMLNAWSSVMIYLMTDFKYLHE